MNFLRIYTCTEHMIILVFSWLMVYERSTSYGRRDLIRSKPENFGHPFVYMIPQIKYNWKLHCRYYELSF
jgi:hypothetical protein